MRSIRFPVLAVVTLAIANAGCSCFGWRVEMSKTAAIMVPVPVQHTSGDIQVNPIGGTSVPKMSKVEAILSPQHLVIPTDNSAVKSKTAGPCQE